VVQFGMALEVSHFHYLGSLKEGCHSGGAGLNVPFGRVTGCNDL